MVFSIDGCTFDPPLAEGETPQQRLEGILRRCTRPTVDLGEDGELVGRALTIADYFEPNDLSAAAIIRELVDRLERYREALDPETLTNRIWDKLDTIDTAPGHGDAMLTYAELKTAIGAVLSRG